jgi:CubicO group peptidase (beta-lactamase class C family)
VVSWGDGARPLAVHSIRKSLISALYGQLHDRGSLRLDTTIGELGIDDTPALTDTEKTATIEDLLTARSGGELYLRHGQWQGAQLISRTWIERSVRPQTATPLAPGLLGAFGYCWWIAGPDGDLPRLGLPSGTFSAFGFGGNFLTVLPAVDAVVCVLDDPAPVPAPSSPPARVHTEGLTAAAYSTFLRQVVLELS